MDKKERQRFLTRERVRLYRQRQKWLSRIQERNMTMDEEVEGSEGSSDAEDAEGNTTMDKEVKGSEEERHEGKEYAKMCIYQ